MAPFRARIPATGRDFRSINRGKPLSPFNTERYRSPPTSRAHRQAAPTEPRTADYSVSAAAISTSSGTSRLNLPGVLPAVIHDSLLVNNRR